MISSLLSLLSVVWAVGARDIAYEECGGRVLSVSVDGCVREPCEIPRGSAATIRVRCLSNADASRLRLTVWAEVAGSEVPYPGMRRDACKGKNLTCPIANNQEIGYVQRFEVKNFFPTLETKARFHLVTHDDRDIVVCCFKAPVKVVKKEETTPPTNPFFSGNFSS